MLAVKRKGIEAVMVIVLFLLETTVFHYFEIASVKPNLLLILTASRIHGEEEECMLEC